MTHISTISIVDECQPMFASVLRGKVRQLLPAYVLGEVASTNFHRIATKRPKIRITYERTTQLLTRSSSSSKRSLRIFSKAPLLCSFFWISSLLNESSISSAAEVS